MGVEFALRREGSVEHRADARRRVTTRVHPALVVGRRAEPQEDEADRIAGAVVAGLAQDRSSLIGAESTRIRRNGVRTRIDPTPERTIRRAVIPAAVSGLAADIDSTSRQAFARAVSEVWDPTVLAEIQRLIETEQRTPGLDPAIQQANLQALWCVRDRLDVLNRPEESRIKMSDPRYAKYQVKSSLDTAERLIDTAVAKLGSIDESTPMSNSVMQTFRSFFISAKPSEIRARLLFAKAQIAHYRPQAPPGVVDKGGGHACIDPSMADMQYMNQGEGHNARLIIGVKAWSMTPGARAYNVVHEATHGAPQLKTVDHAYRWQRLFPYLGAEHQLENADSYGMLVGFLAGLSAASTGMTDAQKARKDLNAPGEDVETNGLPPAVDDAVKRGWAWLEYYATQVFVNLRDLMPALERGDQLVPGSYQKTLWDTIEPTFPFAPDPLRTFDSIKKHFDRLVQYTAFAKPMFCSASPAAPLDGDRFPIVVPSNLNLDLKHLTLWHLVTWHRRTGLTPTEAGKYEVLLPAIVQASGWIGPMSA